MPVYQYEVVEYRTEEHIEETAMTLRGRTLQEVHQIDVPEQVTYEVDCHKVTFEVAHIVFWDRAGQVIVAVPSSTVLQLRGPREADHREVSRN